MPAPTTDRRSVDAVIAKRNWIEAAVRALYVHLTFYDALDEPIGAFAAASHITPRPQTDGSWLWAFAFVEDAAEYDVFLYGRIEGDHVDWRMEVACSSPALMLDHFVWFDGQSQRDESFGYWQFYTPLTAPATGARLYMASMTPGVRKVRMDWESFGPGDHRVSVIVNEVGSPDEGDLVVFDQSPTVTVIEYHDQDRWETHNVTWYPDGSGNTTAPDYNRGRMACWDSRQDNIVCP